MLSQLPRIGYGPIVPEIFSVPLFSLIQIMCVSVCNQKNSPLSFTCDSFLCLLLLPQKIEKNVSESLQEY